MDQSEALRLAETLQRQRPGMNARPYLNHMTDAYEVEVNGGDPRGIRLWLKSPRHVLRYMVWLNRQASEKGGTAGEARRASPNILLE